MVRLSEVCPLEFSNSLSCSSPVLTLTAKKIHLNDTMYNTPFTLDLLYVKYVLKESTTKQLRSVLSQVRLFLACC